MANISGEVLATENDVYQIGTATTLPINPTQLCTYIKATETYGCKVRPSILTPTYANNQCVPLDFVYSTANTHTNNIIYVYKRYGTILPMPTEPIQVLSAVTSDILLTGISYGYANAGQSNSAFLGSMEFHATIKSGSSNFDDITGGYESYTAKGADYVDYQVNYIEPVSDTTYNYFVKYVYPANPT